MASTSTLLNCLAEALTRKGIAYCHWKSNFNLEKIFSGEKDFELLVDRTGLPQAVAILLSLGFKPALAAWEPSTRGVHHYYGSDPQTGTLFHVHLFSKVLTGEGFLESHWLPVEPMLFESVCNNGKIKAPSKEAELIVYVLRVFIKYGSLPDLLDLFGRSGQIAAESRWLQTGCDISEALRLLKKHCPVIDEKLFVKCVNALNTSTSLVTKILMARQVRRRLRIYVRLSGLSRLSAYSRLLWGKAMRLLDGNKKGKVLDAGGAIIAFVGPEATGKTTLVSECGRWLGSALAVKTIHAGKPPSSCLTFPIHQSLPLIRALLPRLRTTRLEKEAFATNPLPSQIKEIGSSSLVYALRAVMVAWERRRLLLKARRLAVNGEIVICDRYPSDTIGTMDSPRLRKNPAKRGSISAIYNWLARLEHKLYDQIPPPDIALRLKVSIATAKKRNTERLKADKETAAYVESRHRQSQEWRRSETKYVYDIDTERPLDETIMSVKNAIWQSL